MTRVRYDRRHLVRSNHFHPDVVHVLADLHAQETACGQRRVWVTAGDGARLTCRDCRDALASKA